MSPADLLAAYLATAGHGSRPPVAPWPLYVGHMPDANQAAGDNAICVYDTAGTTDGRHQRTGQTIEHPGIQVRVRAAVYPTGYDKARAIADFLDEIFRVTVVDGLVTRTLQAVTRRGNIIPLGNELDGKRQSFTINATVTIPVNGGGGLEPGLGQAIIWNEVPTGDIDGSNRTFTLAYTPVTDKILVYRNGMLMNGHAGGDFVLSGNTIVFSTDSIPTVDCIIMATYQTVIS